MTDRYVDVNSQSNLHADKNMTTKDFENLYKVNIKGLSEQGELKMRNIGRELSFKVKGSMSDEDKALYNTNMFIVFYDINNKRTNHCKIF